VTHVRLIATDLDGTLLRAGGVVSQRNKDALRAAREAGIDVVLVTGRPPRWVDEIAEELELDGVAICANGAILYDLATKEVVNENLLPADTLRRIVEALREVVPGVGFAFERSNGLTLEPHFHTVYDDSEEEGVRRAAGEVFLDAPVAKLLASHPGVEFEELLVAAVEAAGTEAVVTHSGDSGLIEVSASGITKAFALEELCAERGIAADEVVAFGDMPNDVLLLKWAGRGVAVANAHPDAIDAADEVTESNNDDGVAIVIERLLAQGSG
jgi:Cof subfamily protein (haloacid dehalogenase superfamily)